MFHKAKLNNTAIVFRKIHVSTSLLKDLSNPVLPSCELYSFLVVYICTFLCVVVEGSRSEGLLWCILFHQFCLNWTFIGYYAESSALGEILPVVRDFCSLYLVRFVPPPSLLLTHEEQAEWGRTFGGVIPSEHGSGERRGTSFSAAQLTSVWATLPPVEYAVIVERLYFNCVGLLLPAVCPTALRHPNLLHSNHRLCVQREINIILCLMYCLVCLFFFRVFKRRNITTYTYTYL